MNGGGGRPVRIAHAHGNRRDRIQAAVAAEIDFIEADIWHRAGEIWVRHERRLGFVPLLYDRKPQGVNSVGPWALTVFPNHYIRLDVEPLRLAELVERAQGKRLLLDLKTEGRGEDARACARTLSRVLAEARCEESVIVCGQTDVLDSVREESQHLDVRHSIERQQQWNAFLRRLDADGRLRGVCMQREFLSDEIAQFLKDRGLQVFCWTVDDAAEAARLLELGIDGIISNSLPLLEQLGAPSRLPPGPP